MWLRSRNDVAAPEPRRSEFVLMAMTAVAGLLTTLAGGAMAVWVFRHFGSDKSARIAAFWLTAGAAAASTSSKGELSPELLPLLARFAGAALAVVILWWWLLRRLPADET
jgi:hypothetical protein